MLNRCLSRLFAGLAAILLLLSAVSCRQSPSSLESSADERETVMTIGGVDVPMEMYRYVALNCKADYESGRTADIWLGESGEELLGQLEDDVEEKLVILYTPVSLAAEYGIDPDGAYIRDTIDLVMKDIYESYDYDYARYRADLYAQHMTDSVYRFLLRDDLLREELAYSMTEKGELPSDESELRSIISSDEIIRVKQILIPASNGKTEAENRRTAESLLARALTGEDFDQLVQQYGGDVNLFNNPDGYYIARGSYYPLFEETAFSLGIGEISGVIETPAGFSIVKRYEKDESYLSGHYDALAEEYRAGRMNLIVEAYQSAMTVTREKALSGYSIFNLEATKDEEKK